MIKGENRIAKVVVVAFVFMLATVPESLLYDGKNTLLLGGAIAGMLLLIVYHVGSFPSMRHDWLFIVLGYFTIVSLANWGTSRPLSLVYSVFFIATYVFYASWAKRSLSLKDYRSILHALMLLYLIGTLIGQFVVYAGLYSPEKELSLGSFHGGFHSILSVEGFRYYSFSSEPSYAAFIVIMVYYSFIFFDPQKGSLFKGENFIMMLMLAYMMVMFRSGYGLVLFGVILMSYLRLSKTLVVTGGFMLFAGLVLVTYAEDFEPFRRIENILTYTELDNLHTIRTADFNVYVRVAPMLHYFESHALTDVALYFGHGSGSSRDFVVPEIYLAYVGEFEGGFLPAFFYDYGLIGVALIIVFVGALLPRLVSVPTAILTLVLLNANLNTQLFWLLIFFLTMNKYYFDIEKFKEGASGKLPDERPALATDK